MICKNCKKEIPEGGIICPFCATPVEKEKKQNELDGSEFYKTEFYQGENVQNVFPKKIDAQDEEYEEEELQDEEYEEELQDEEYEEEELQDEEYEEEELQVKENQNEELRNVDIQNQMQQNTNVRREQKSKVVAGFLGIFLGAFGIHNFYLGYYVKAIIQLCITVLSFGAGAFIIGIWGFVEGVMILSGLIKVDGFGNALAGSEDKVVASQNNINNANNYSNSFVVNIKEKRDNVNSTIIIGDVISGSISVGEIARIEDLRTHSLINTKILSIEEEGMNVLFSMDKNILIKIDKIDINNTANVLVK